MRIVLHIVFLCSIVLHVRAQSLSLRQSTFDFFDLEESQGLNWEKDMVGKLDDRTNFQLYLITDSYKFHGAFTVTGSSYIHYLEGEQDENHVTFFEYDEEGNFVATIQGDFSDHDFYGIWKDKKRIEEKSFTAHDMNYYRKESFWVKAFEQGDDYLLLCKTNPEIHVSGRLDHLPLSAALECYDEDCSTYAGSFTSVKSDESFSGTVTIRTEEVKLNTELNHSKSLPLKNALNLVYSENNTSGRTYRIDVDFTDKSLNNIWNTFSEFETTSQSDSEDFESSQEIEIDFLGKRYFSGILRYQNNSSSKIIEKTFIFDLKRKKLLDYKQVIKKDDIVKREINELIPESENIDDLLYSFSSEGLVVRTPFNLLYGQEKYTIPFLVLKSKKLN